MKKGERYYSSTHGLITIVDGRRRTDWSREYVLARNENGEIVQQSLSHWLIELTDDQWSALRRLWSTDYHLKQFVIEQFRLGHGPGKVGNDLQKAADQLLCNPG